MWFCHCDVSPRKNAGWLLKTLIDDVCQNTSPLKYQHYFFGIPFASLLVAVMTTSDSQIATPKSPADHVILYAQHAAYAHFLLHILQEAKLGFVSGSDDFVVFSPWHGNIKNHHQITI